MDFDKWWKDWTGQWDLLTKEALKPDFYICWHEALKELDEARIYKYKYENALECAEKAEKEYHDLALELSLLKRQITPIEALVERSTLHTIDRSQSGHTNSAERTSASRE